MKLSEMKWTPDFWPDGTKRWLKVVNEDLRAYILQAKKSAPWQIRFGFRTYGGESKTATAAKKDVAALLKRLEDGTFV